MIYPVVKYPVLYLDEPVDCRCGCWVIGFGYRIVNWRECLHNCDHMSVSLCSSGTYVGLSFIFIEVFAMPEEENRPATGYV